MKVLGIGINVYNISSLILKKISVKKPILSMFAEVVEPSEHVFLVILRNCSRDF